MRLQHYVSDAVFRWTRKLASIICHWRFPLTFSFHSNLHKSITYGNFYSNWLSIASIAHITTSTTPTNGGRHRINKRMNNFQWKKRIAQECDLILISLFFVSIILYPVFMTIVIKMCEPVPSSYIHIYIRYSYWI